MPSLRSLMATESKQHDKGEMCVTIDQDDPGLVPLTDGISTAENGLRHIGWAVPDSCGGQQRRHRKLKSCWCQKSEHTETRVNGSYRRCLS